MIGLLITEMKSKEIECLVKRELEELLLDLENLRIDQVVIKHILAKDDL